MTMSKHRQQRGRVGEEGRFWLGQNLIEVVGGMGNQQGWEFDLSITKTIDSIEKLMIEFPTLANSHIASEKKEFHI